VASLAQQPQLNLVVLLEYVSEVREASWPT